MPVVTGIDILGIQRYVFASDRLRDVLAATWLVEHVTSETVLCQWNMTCDRVLLAAGGNSIVEFDTPEDAREWTALYTRWWQDEAPGLEVVVAHREYDAGRLAWALKALQVELARRKLERLPDVPQLGLGVTASCSVTGLPANMLDQYDSMPISSRIDHLRNDAIQSKAKERWHQFRPSGLERAPGWKADFPDVIDHMGRSRGDTSLLGIVHVDGNGIGKIITDWIGRCIENKEADEQVRNQYREWSGAIDSLGNAVLSAVVKRVASGVVEERDERDASNCFVRGTPHELGFPLTEDTTDKASQMAFLPLRPVLLGGDDLTFLCDGRIALDLAVTALREFDRHSIPHLGRDGGDATLTACAGVALVKAHAPFHRGYELAEELCASAKRARRKAQSEHGNDAGGCWIDWHVGTTRPGENVKEIRKREYERDSLSLTMRPYPFREFPDREQSWDWLDREFLGPSDNPNDAFRGFQELTENGETRLVANVWAGSRHRVKRLGSLVPNGGDAIQRQVEAWKAVEQRIRLPGGIPENGFFGHQTPLLDAIELMDFHLRLEHDPSVSDTLLGGYAPIEKVTQ